ncbi:MAG: motility protein A [Clostridia bacterium]|nr:motility protein A [Clostridia bacterium]
MNLSTVIGIIAGFSFIFASIFMGGDLTSYFDFSSILIVLGGTLSSTIVSYSFDQLKIVLQRLPDVFQKSKIDLSFDLEHIVNLSMIARRQGLLALDDEEYDDPFLQKGIELIVDGTDPELVEEILDHEISLIEEEGQIPIKVYSSMAQFAPAFGMVGTLIGLINMLRYLSDSDSLGPAMSTALITTFYGVILANLVFLPFAQKIRTANARRLARYEMIMTGILAMQNGENPRLIREKMETFIPVGEKKQAEMAKATDGATLEHAQQKTVSE